MYCSKCGAQNQDDANFCIKCGSGLSELPPQTNPKKEQVKQILREIFQIKEEETAENIQVLKEAGAIILILLILLFVFVIIKGG